MTMMQSALSRGFAMTTTAGRVPWIGTTRQFARVQAASLTCRPDVAVAPTSAPAALPAPLQALGDGWHGATNHGLQAFLPYEALQTAHGAMLAHVGQLERTLVVRDSQVTQLRLALERATMQLQDVAAAAPSVADRRSIDPRGASAQGSIGVQGAAQMHDNEEEEEAMDWIMEIIEAREAFADDSIRHVDGARRLVQLEHRLEAIRDDRVDLSAFDLSTISGVLGACALCELPTTRNGNCQFYALVQAATQQCLLLLKDASAVSRLEHVTKKLKCGIRGSARLSFKKAYTNPYMLLSLLEDTKRVDEDADMTYDDCCANVKGYFDDLAKNTCELMKHVDSKDWGCSVSLIESSKVLGRPIYVLTVTQNGVHFQRYVPTDPTGPGSMFMAVSERHVQSFKEWTDLLLMDLKASKTQPERTPLVVTLRGDHYDAVVVDPSSCDAPFPAKPAAPRRPMKQLQQQLQKTKTEEKQKLQQQSACAHAPSTPLQSVPAPANVAAQMKKERAPPLLPTIPEGGSLTRRAAKREHTSPVPPTTMESVAVPQEQQAKEPKRKATVSSTRATHDRAQPPGRTDTAASRRAGVPKQPTTTATAKATAAQGLPRRGAGQTNDQARRTQTRATKASETRGASRVQPKAPAPTIAKIPERERVQEVQGRTPARLGGRTNAAAATALEPAKARGTRPAGKATPTATTKRPSPTVATIAQAEKPQPRWRF